MNPRAVKKLAELLRQSNARKTDAKLADLTRLTALLEDRQGLVNVIRAANYMFETNPPADTVRSEFLADSLIAYLKEQK